MGRLLDSELLPPTPVRSKEYAALCDVAYMASGDSFEAFFSMFTFNKRARGLLNKMRENLAKVEREIESKRSYIAAVSDLKSKERQKLIAETKLLLREIVNNDSESQSDAQVESLAEGETPTNSEPKSEANTQNSKGKK